MIITFEERVVYPCGTIAAIVVTGQNTTPHCVILKIFYLLLSYNIKVVILFYLELEVSALTVHILQNTGSCHKSLPSCF